MSNQLKKQSLLSAATEYFNLYGVSDIEKNPDGTLTDNGAYKLQELANKYRDVDDTDLDEEDAFLVVCEAYREFISNQ
jgi:hypothetical protein